MMRKKSTDKEILEEISRIFGNHTLVKKQYRDYSNKDKPMNDVVFNNLE